MESEELINLRAKMKKARIEHIYDSSFIDSKKSLKEFKFEIGDVMMLEHPIQRLLHDTLYQEIGLIDNFRVLYHTYKELGLDLIDELKIKMSE